MNFVQKLFKVKNNIQFTEKLLWELYFNYGKTYKFFNYIFLKKYPDDWLKKFIEVRNINPKKKKMYFFSVFGPSSKVKYFPVKPKIFYTAESTLIFNSYTDLCLDYVDLSLGFEFIKADNYLRLPFWIQRFIAPNADEKDIKNTFDLLEQARWIPREKFCANVSSHDKFGSRGIITSHLENISHVEYGGKYKNNTNELKIKYENRKTEYLKQFYFNVCPENVDQEGYVTEKLFDSIQAGCIPIYFGSKGSPELQILNQDAMIKLDVDDLNNREQYERVRDLYHDPKKLKDFIEQERFTSNAARIVASWLDELEFKLKGILSKY